MTTIEKLEDDSNNITNELIYRKRFIEVLGDPSKWVYSGVCNDLNGPVGHCICGHAIRFEYVIEYGCKKQVVGSECINNFATINPKLYNDLVEADKAMKDRIKEMKKVAKDIEQQREIVELKSKYEISYKAFTDKYDGYIKSGQRVPYGLWLARNASGNFIRKEPKEYSRKCDYIRWYKEGLARIDRVMKDDSNVIIE